MATLDAREVARRALDRVLRDAAYATLALSGELSRATVSAPDRALATEIVYGVLRHKSRLDRALESAVPNKLKVAPKIRVALWVGAYQILFLDRVPDHAAVDDAVLAVKKVAGERMAGFANALLRKLATTGEPPFTESDPVERLAAEFSMPAWMVYRLRREVGADDLGEAVAAFARPAPITLRTNLLKTSRSALAERLGQESAKAQVAVVEGLDAALTISGMGAVESSAAFQAGLFSIQDAGAQRVGELVEVRPGIKILDACAGVGGKTTHLAERGGDQVRIVAADSSERKLDLLAGSARRLGLSSIATVQIDLARDPVPGGPFDVVLLDAPCTGLGVLRRHPEAKWRIEEKQIAAMVAVQKQMLARLCEQVAPGGILVYSVCSFTSDEGSKQIAEFLQSHPDFSQIGSFRTWPHRDNADGFFAAALQRKS